MADANYGVPTGDAQPKAFPSAEGAVQGKVPNAVRRKRSPPLTKRDILSHQKGNDLIRHSASLRATFP